MGEGEAGGELKNRILGNYPENTLPCFAKEPADKTFLKTHSVNSI